jgi:hypothetical protein
MLATWYPIATLDTDGNGMVVTGPTVQGSNPWRAILALRDAGVTLPEIDDMVLVDGRDGATVYVGSFESGKWYAAIVPVTA